jgi:hypothetical protein
VAILAGNLRSLMQSRETRRELGASTHELEGEVAELRRARSELTERIQNLETIVVSQTWSVLQDKVLTSDEKDNRLAAIAPHETRSETGEGTSRQRAEQLARRMQ